jgi:peptidoglycan-associated lipoprotein
MKRVQFSRSALALLMMVCSLLLFSCKHPTASAPTVSAAPPPAVAPPPPPPAAAAAPTITLAANPGTIDRGQSTTLTWTAQNAASVTIAPDLGQVAISGNRQVTPQSSVTYMATATGPGGTRNATAMITVNAPPPPAATTTAPPARGGRGGNNNVPTAAPTPATGPSVDTLFTQNVASQSIYFDFDKAEIKSSETGKLSAIVAWLKQYPNVRFTIGGHADERGSQEYNLALGDRRANAVKDYLGGNGIAGTRILVTSFGEERPVCRESNEECWSKNRRAAFTFNP